MEDRRDEEKEKSSRPAKHGACLQSQNTGGQGKKTTGRDPVSKHDTHTHKRLKLQEKRSALRTLPTENFPGIRRRCIKIMHSEHITCAAASSPSELAALGPGSRLSLPKRISYPFHCLSQQSLGVFLSVVPASLVTGEPKPVCPVQRRCWPPSALTSWPMLSCSSGRARDSLAHKEIRQFANTN